MDKRWTRASFASPEHPSDTRIPRRASGAGGSGPPLVLAVHAWPARDAAAVPGEPKRPVAGSRRSPPFARSGAPFVLRHRRHRVPAAGHGAQRRRDPSGLISRKGIAPAPGWNTPGASGRRHANRIARHRSEQKTCRCRIGSQGAAHASRTRRSGPRARIVRFRTTQADDAARPGASPRGQDTIRLSNRRMPAANATEETTW
jgi:hypothetical protein